MKAVDIPALFKDNSVSYNKIDTVDWAAEFPYCPQVEFAIAHKGDAILLHYRVEEDSVRAEAGTDLGPVWQDSCCEFFCSPDEEGGYINLESNCSRYDIAVQWTGTGESYPCPCSCLRAD